MPSDRDGLRVLAERCEHEEPGRALDHSIMWALRPRMTGEDPAPHYTSSLDAAVTLAPDDPANLGKPMLWSIAYDEDGVGGDRSYLASLGKGYHDPEFIYGHSDVCAALALCAAALRVRAALANNSDCGAPRPEGAPPPATKG